jgi:hypothetical protein
MVAHAGSGEVNDGCDAGEVTGRERSRYRVPGDLVAGPRRASDKVHDLVAPGGQERRQRAADQS